MKLIVIDDREGYIAVNPSHITSVRAIGDRTMISLVNEPDAILAGAPFDVMVAAIEKGLNS